MKLDIKHHVDNFIAKALTIVQCTLLGSGHEPPRGIHNFCYNTLIFTVSEQKFFLFGSWRNVKNGMLLETTVSNANWIKERTIRQKGREILLWTMDKMEYKFYYAFSVVLYALISEMIEDFFFILSCM